MRERFNVAAGEQMMHYGVADEDDLGNLRLAAAGQAHDELPEEYAKHLGQIIALERSPNSAHDVGAERGLGIELGFHSQNFAGSEVKDLRGNGRGAEIDRDAEAVFSGTDEASIVGEDIHAPLAALKDQRHEGARLTGETPAKRKLLGQEGRAVWVGDRKGAGKDANCAPSTGSGASAGKFDALA
jgi:hypothetical protein